MVVLLLGLRCNVGEDQVSAAVLHDLVRGLEGVGVDLIFCWIKKER
jgi:hypothetical protein